MAKNSDVLLCSLASSSSSSSSSSSASSYSSEYWSESESESCEKKEILRKMKKTCENPAKHSWSFRIRLSTRRAFEKNACGYERGKYRATWIAKIPSQPWLSFLSCFFALGPLSRLLLRLVKKRMLWKTEHYSCKREAHGKWNVANTVQYEYQKYVLRSG